MGEIAVPRVAGKSVRDRQSDPQADATMADVGCTGLVSSKAFLKIVMKSSPPLSEGASA